MLLASRRLAPLMATQTLGAVNDNLFKNALVVMVLFRAAHDAGPALAALAGGVFILPYMLLSATAGQLAERSEKRRLILLTKCAELGLMALASAGFLLGSTPLLFVVLFGLGVQATLFGPLKYAVLPQHLERDELVAGNGLVEAGTFGGILAGTIAGPLLFGLDHGAALVSAAGCLVAVLGVGAAWLIPTAPASAPGLRLGRNPWVETRRLLAQARGHRTVWRCILALSWFWVMGATLLALLPSLVRDALGASGPAAGGHVFTVLLTVFSVGVGLGSVGCGRLLRGQVSPRFAPLAALGLSLFLWDFAHAAGHAQGLASTTALLRAPAGWRMLADLLLLGACGGLFSVPLYAVIQERAPAAELSRMVAANNVVNAVAMVLAAGVTALLAVVGVAPGTMLAGAALANLAAAVWTLRLLPPTAFRAVFRWYFRVFHHAEIAGLEHLPPSGTPCVVVVNHQSFLDGCFVAAFLPHAPVFAVNIHVARRWWARPFLAAVRHIALDPVNPFGTKTLVRAVQDGETLAVFPEGRITQTGALMKVYEGAGMVADRARAPVVPVRIDGLQFTKFSRLGGVVPRRWFPRLRLTVLPAVTLSAEPGLTGRARRRALGAQLQDVVERSAFAATPTGHTLFAGLLAAAGRYGRATPIIEDTARAPMSYGRLILGACVLGRALTRLVKPGSPVGVMLPNANGAVATFLALQAFGRVPAMLNFSAGAEAMLAACQAAQVTTVLCSRAFVARAKLETAVARMERQVAFVWLEDVRATLGLRAKLRGLLDARRAHTLPGARVPADSAAVVLFTSGSEGAPKGVVLSHRNILANIAQISSVIDFNPRDRVFNAMPMFHSFGLTGATLLPLLSGVRTFYYPSPLHYRIVPELIYDTDSSIAFGTDTFLTGWARFAHAYDFYRMRYIFAGAERVREETRRLYAEKFGVRVLEGYGATETSPVLALNTPMHSRPGAAGWLLPGIEHRLDAVEGIDDGGRLVVRGPNVMLGYLRTSAPGVLEPPDGGWYDTGDICTVQDGFVTITARAKRFAKIAGEMVSMPAAEARAAELWPHALHAVVAVEDPRKGEALVLLTTQTDATVSALLAHARTHGAAELGVPRVVRVLDALPLLGTGKIDYVSATLIGADRAEMAEV